MSGFALHLLRHGEPEGAGRLIGHTDAAPTAAGVAACVAQARDLGVEVLIASDLARARLAGEAIAGEQGAALTLDPRWRELDFGEWDGCDPGALDPAVLGRFWSDPERHPPPGGERWSDLTARVSAALNDLAHRPTLVVAHAGAMRAAISVLCGLDAAQVWALDLPYGALLSLRVWPGAKLSAQIVGLYPCAG